MNDERSDLLSAAGCVPVGPCARCEREVVAYPVDDEASGGYACTHCNGVVRQVSWLDDGELDALGYSVSDPQLGGCATGCASGGCSARPLR
jgi:hypothetical protein